VGWFLSFRFHFSHFIFPNLVTPKQPSGVSKRSHPPARWPRRLPFLHQLLWPLLLPRALCTTRGWTQPASASNISPRRAGEGREGRAAGTAGLSSARASSALSWEGAPRGARPWPTPGAPGSRAPWCWESPGRELGRRCTPLLKAKLSRRVLRSESSFLKETLAVSFGCNTARFADGLQN